MADYTGLGGGQYSVGGGGRVLSGGYYVPETGYAGTWARAMNARNMGGSDFSGHHDSSNFARVISHTSRRLNQAQVNARSGVHVVSRRSTPLTAAQAGRAIGRVVSRTSTPFAQVRAAAGVPRALPHAQIVNRAYTRAYPTLSAQARADYAAAMNRTFAARQRQAAAIQAQRAWAATMQTLQSMSAYASYNKLLQQSRLNDGNVVVTGHTPLHQMSPPPHPQRPVGKTGVPRSTSAVRSYWR